MVKQLKSLTFVNDNISNTYQVSSDTNPDWNQNDETAADYVKNRTHYVGDPVETVLLEETFIETSGDGNIYGIIPASIVFVEGQTYNITFNGTEYECIAWYYSDFDSVVIGNGSIIGGEGGNGEPFACESYSDGSCYLNTPDKGIYTLKIVGMITEVVKLPAQFLVNSNICNGEGEYSINEGMSTASGHASHAEGMSTASGHASHAEGEAVIASGHASHAEGEAVIASGYASHAEGGYTYALGHSSHAEGRFTAALGDYSHAEGRGAYALIRLTGDAGSTSYTVYSSSNISTIAIGDFIAVGDAWSIVAGYDSSTKTITLESTLNADSAFNLQSAILYSSGIASGNGSHSEGNKTVASGDSSHAEGQGTIATDNAQHVQGRYNLQDIENKYAHIVGNGVNNGGVDDTRSNAHTLDWEGNAWFAGKIYTGGTGQDDENATEVATLANSEEWVFTLEDGSTVTKRVVLG